MSGNEPRSATRRAWGRALTALILLTAVGACSVFQKGAPSPPVVLDPRGPVPGEGPIDGGPDTAAVLPAPVDSVPAPVDRVLLDPPVMAWMLPFTLDRRSLDVLRAPDDQKRNRPLVALGFWEGALLAADTLEARGYAVDLYAFDTRNSAQTVRQLCARPELLDVDLILGPVFDAPMQEALAFAGNRGIPVVSPLRVTPLAPPRPGLYGVRPPNELLLEGLGRHLATARPRDNVVVLRRDSAEEVRLTQRLLHGMAGGGPLDSARRSRVTEWVTDFRLKGLADTLSLVAHNAVVVPSRDEVFVNAVCRSLSTLASTGDYRLSVYGLPDWQRFESVALDYLQRIDWHFPVHYLPAADSAFHAAFERRYRERFHTPPTELAYLGYDLTLYFGMALSDARTGERDPDLDGAPMHRPGMADAFGFRPSRPLGPDGTAPADSLPATVINRHGHLLRYVDGRFVAVPGYGR